MVHPIDVWSKFWHIYLFFGERTTCPLKHGHINAAAFTSFMRPSSCPAHAQPLLLATLHYPHFSARKSNQTVDEVGGSAYLSPCITQQPTWNFYFPEEKTLKKETRKEEYLLCFLGSDLEGNSCLIWVLTLEAEEKGCRFPWKACQADSPLLTPYIHWPFDLLLAPPILEILRCRVNQMALTYPTPWSHLT